MIVHSAIRKEGKIYTGKRHCDIINDYSYPFGFFKWCDQGFITNRGVFLDRIEAGKHALECGQIKRLDLDGRLYSGDLL